MTLTTHALVGAVIGKYFQSPLLIIPVSIIAHYSIDAFRHGEYLNKKSTWKDTTWKVLLDLFIGIISVFLLIREQSGVNFFNISIGVFFSLLPDFLTLLYWKLGVKQLKFLYSFHTNIHLHPQASPERAWKIRNLINDFIFCTVSVILLMI